MSTTDDFDTTASSRSATTDILIPLDPDKEPIIWDGNDAHIEGLLFEVGKYYRRVGIFQPLLKDHAVALSNGKLAVDSVHSLSLARASTCFWSAAGTLASSRRHDGRGATHISCPGLRVAWERRLPRGPERRSYVVRVVGSGPK